MLIKQSLKYANKQYYGERQYATMYKIKKETKPEPADALLSEGRWKRRDAVATSTPFFFLRKRDAGRDKQTARQCRANKQMLRLTIERRAAKANEAVTPGEVGGKTAEEKSPSGCVCRINRQTMEFEPMGGFPRASCRQRQLVAARPGGEGVYLASPAGDSERWRSRYEPG